MKKLTFIALGLTLSLLVPVVWAEMGAASISGTTPNSPIRGNATFVDTKEGLQIAIRMSGAPAGAHGLHVHEFGSCDDTGKAAGGHYNPLNVAHGMIMKDGAKKAHQGDLGNIEIGADGTGNLNAVVKGLTLSSGKHTVGGRAVVMHEKADDFGQPVGNAGGRIGCGVISILGK